MKNIKKCYLINKKVKKSLQKIKNDSKNRIISNLTNKNSNKKTNKLNKEESNNQLKISSYIINHMNIVVSDYYRWLYSTRNSIGASNRYISIDQDDYIHYTNKLSGKQSELNNLRRNVQYRYFHDIK